MQLPKTFNCYRDRPLTRMIDMRAVPARTVAAQTKLAHDKGDKVTPDAVALEYYYWAHWVNHVAVTCHKHESVGQWESSIENFFEHGSDLAVRIFHYLVLICTRESRHANVSPSRLGEMKNKFGEWAHPYWQMYVGGGKPKAVQCWHHIGELVDFKQFDEVSMGTYSTWLVWMFRRASYSGGFGGKKWAEVAEILRLFVHGEITAEMMVDQAFNASHNNGPIFNKGMLFNDYTGQFVNILDVQRSGQIPNLVVEQANYGKAWYPLPVSITDDMDHERRLKLPIVMEHGTDYVDWYRVELLGAVKTYYNEKKYQTENYGDESEYAEQAQKQHLAEPVKYYVMQGLEVPIVKRSQSGKFSTYTVGDKMADDKKAAEAK